RTRAASSVRRSAPRSNERCPPSLTTCASASCGATRQSCSAAPTFSPTRRSRRQMAGLAYRAPLSVTAEVAWDFLDRYTRAEVHVFSSCIAERSVDDYRVVTITDGSEV